MDEQHENIFSRFFFIVLLVITFLGASYIDSNDISHQQSFGETQWAAAEEEQVQVDPKA